MLLWVVAYSIIGAAIYLIVVRIPMPFTMISLFKLGLAPALAVIAVMGAVRGPIAGLLTGYIGEVMHALILSGSLVTATLPALAYGSMGFVVGLTRYEFARGRSLAKLSLLSVAGFMMTALLVLVIDLFVESFGTLAAIGFAFLPLVTVGLPTVALLTPLFARVLYFFTVKIRPCAIGAM
jgi:hypothetical protein